MNSIRYIYSHNIEDKVDSTKFCPSRSMRGNYDDEGNFISDVEGNVITISGDNYQGFSINEIPDCENPNFFEDSNDTSGCCKVNNAEFDKSYRYEYNMGFIYSITGTSNDGSYNIYHKQPIQTFFNFLDDPNDIKKFIKIIFAAIFGILVASIIGSCYEFWLRYGNSIDCLYYIGKCKNIGDESKSGQAGKVNLIDYVFPNSICFYPYQKCITTSQSGGKIQKGGGLLDSLEEKERVGFHSNYISYKKTNDGKTAKCITLDNSDYDTDGRPFPYNIADFEIQNKSIKIILKMFTFSMLFPILFTRYVLNKIMSWSSSGFQRIVKNNKILSNFIFAILIGAIPINLGGITLLTLIIGVISTITPILSPLLVLFSMTPASEKIKNFRRTLESCSNEENLVDYYNLFKEIFWNYFYTTSTESDIKIKIKKYIIFILSLLPLALTLIIGLMFVLLGSSLSTFYMVLSTIFNFFYIPLKNPIEILDIMKDHSGLLTVLLCISVVVSSGYVFDTQTTSILSFFVAILILYKIMTYNK